MASVLTNRMVVACLLMLLPTLAVAKDRPNVVIVVGDDIGYGDFSCHGNTQLKTPYVDALHAESVRLANFHVDPTCSPTRSALLTGKYSRRVGVWHTIAGRSLLHTDETTMAEHFGAAGYDTAIFGKWHLGDNYPLRPQDQGFEQVLVHKGGGVGQSPDFWGNDYFGDTYFLNGERTKYEGYCTDIWFGEAEEWLESRGDNPFFLYITPNAAHSPYNVAESYSRPFHKAGIPSPRAEFYGMIVNLDENVGRLRARLEKLGLAENTIFIFMTDNGSAAGTRSGGFNAGMRGAKGSPYDGGHRVPCFIHWPAGGFDEGRDINALTAHIDLLPTLADFCDVPLANEKTLDGTSLVSLISAGEPLEERALVVESQRVQDPIKWRRCAVMAGPWRLVNRSELYNLESDPGQKKNLAKQQPAKVQELQRDYDRWWNDISKNDDRVARIVLGHESARRTRLCVHDWHPPKPDGQLRGQSSQEKIATDPAFNGYWLVDVAETGRYRFELRRRPVSHPLPIAATKATVVCGAKRISSDIDPKTAAPTLTLELPEGPARLMTILEGTDGKTRGAYYVTVERME